MSEGWVCPQCEELVQPPPPASWQPAWGQRPGRSYLDRKPLRPVAGLQGYRSADPGPAALGLGWSRGATSLPHQPGCSGGVAGEGHR